MEKRSRAFEVRLAVAQVAGPRVPHHPFHGLIGRGRKVRDPEDLEIGIHRPASEMLWDSGNQRNVRPNLEKSVDVEVLCTLAGGGAPERRSRVRPWSGSSYGSH